VLQKNHIASTIYTRKDLFQTKQKCYTETPLPIHIHSSFLSGLEGARLESDLKGVFVDAFLFGKFDTGGVYTDGPRDSRPISTVLVDSVLLNDPLGGV
jgi:hypothetical protein